MVSKRARESLLTLHYLPLVDIAAITVALKQMEKVAKAVMRVM
jgi:hypothetical protein